MVAKIVIGKSIRGILHYNENKIAEGEAQLILASNFAGEIGSMNFLNKLQRFEHLNILKPSLKTNALHITLNFEATEKLDSAKMQQIAMAYMEGIGFGDQPFLVYRHNDVAHQHIHIATTSIQRDGTAINLHNIGRDISEPARKSVEKDFGLIVAQSKTYKTTPGIKPADPEKALYGRIPTKRAISNVVTAVTNQYLFTSLAELNAILREFNVTADRGKEETEMFQKKGLIYSLTDSRGNKVGVPIKASSFYSKPTLRNLEKKFEHSKDIRKPYRNQLIKKIDMVLNRYQSITKNTFVAELKKENISLSFRHNEQGLIYGATFIDHKNKTVFNGSDLGKNYSAKVLTEQFGNKDRLKVYLKQAQPTSYLKKPVPEKTYPASSITAKLTGGMPVKTEQAPSSGPKKRKKRKKKQSQELQQNL